MVSFPQQRLHPKSTTRQNGRQGHEAAVPEVRVFQQRALCLGQDDRACPDDRPRRRNRLQTRKRQRRRSRGALRRTAALARSRLRGQRNREVARPRHIAKPGAREDCAVQVALQRKARRPCARIPQERRRHRLRPRLRKRMEARGVPSRRERAYEVLPLREAGVRALDGLHDHQPFQGPGRPVPRRFRPLRAQRGLDHVASRHGFRRGRVARRRAPSERPRSRTACRQAWSGRARATAATSGSSSSAP